MKGLICAGGQATRLGELTRVTNKHLLPVGGWPMVYYPLQLLQLAGVHEVLIVTGKHHAGQMIDLLGDGRLTSRDGSAPLLDVDLTYKVQTEPGGIAQVVGMAREFAGDDGLVVVLGDNIFERSQRDVLRAWGAVPERAHIFVKEVPDPRMTALSPTSSRRREWSTRATTDPRRLTPSWGCTAIRPTCSR